VQTTADRLPAAHRPETLVVAEPDDALRARLGDALRIDHRDLRLCRTAREALSLVAELSPDLVITSLELPDLSGPPIIEVLCERHPGLPVLALTTRPSLQRGVAAIRAGATDVLQSPVHPKLVLDVVDRALAERRSRLDVENAKAVARAGFSRFLSRSPRMHEVFDQIAAVAPTDATVLIRGETGTGKELVSRAIHDHSRRAGRPFIAVNCGAFAESLLESELFGHERGAFTGAAGQRRGLFEMSDSGTLFLDELGETSLSVQVSLLRVLETRRVRRVGGHAEVAVDTRIVAATHTRLEQAVEQGDFREDLYYRLNVFPIQLPPLRERREDIPILARHFIDAASEDFGISAPEVPPDVMDQLVRYAWPGNVRQLRGLCERFVIRAQGSPLSVANLPWTDADMSAPIAPVDMDIDLAVPLKDTLDRHREQLERAYLHRMLAAHGGHLSQTADAAGITRRTLYNRMRAHGLDAEDYRGR